MTENQNNENIHTFEEFQNRLGFGQKIEVGDVIVIVDITFTDGNFGKVALIETPEGRRYTGATALVTFCEELAKHPEFLPMRVEVTQTVSARGRTYQVFR